MYVEGKVKRICGWTGSIVRHSSRNTSLGLQDNILSWWYSTTPGTLSPISFLSFSHLTNVCTQNAMELGPRPVLGPFPLATLTSQAVSPSPIGPEFQTQSSHCLPEEPTWMFNRHLKLNKANAYSFHMHPHLSKCKVCLRSFSGFSGQSSWKDILLCFLSLIPYICFISRSFQLSLTIYPDQPLLTTSISTILKTSRTQLGTLQEFSASAAVCCSAPACSLLTQQME